MTMGDAGPRTEQHPAAAAGAGEAADNRGLPLSSAVRFSAAPVDAARASGPHRRGPTRRLEWIARVRVRHGVGRLGAHRGAPSLDALLDGLLGTLYRARRRLDHGPAPVLHFPEQFQPLADHRAHAVVAAGVARRRGRTAPGRGSGGSKASCGDSRRVRGRDRTAAPGPGTNGNALAVRASELPATRPEMASVSARFPNRSAASCVSRRQMETPAMKNPPEPPPRSPDPGPEVPGTDGSAPSGVPPRSPRAAGWNRGATGIRQRPDAQGRADRHAGRRAAAAPRTGTGPDRRARGPAARRRRLDRRRLVRAAGGCRTTPGGALPPYRPRRPRSPREVEETAWVLPETLTVDLALTPEDPAPGSVRGWRSTPPPSNWRRRSPCPRRCCPTIRTPGSTGTGARLVLGVADPARDRARAGADGRRHTAYRGPADRPGAGVAAGLRRPPKAARRASAPAASSVPLPDLAETIGSDPAGRRIGVRRRPSA